jgi:Ca2+-binding EF-hand superfamily protein
LLSELQKKKFMVSFKMQDVNGNGYLELEDRLLVVKRLAEMNQLDINSAEYKTMHDFTVQLWEQILPHADSNKDGQVSLDEYLAYCEASIPAIQQMAKQGGSNPIAVYMFKMMDVDGSGQVSQSEWGKFTQAWGISEDPLTHFKRLDINSDGQLSFEEVMTLFYQFFTGDNPNDPGNYLFGSIN